MLVSLSWFSICFISSFKHPFKGEMKSNHLQRKWFQYVHFDLSLQKVFINYTLKGFFYLFGKSHLFLSQHRARHFWLLIWKIPYLSFPGLFPTECCSVFASGMIMDSGCIPWLTVFISLLDWKYGGWSTKDHIIEFSPLPRSCKLMSSRDAEVQFLLIWTEFVEV